MYHPTVDHSQSPGAAVLFSSDLDKLLILLWPRIVTPLKFYVRQSGILDRAQIYKAVHIFTYLLIFESSPCISLI